MINATRAGMSPLENVLPVPEELLHKDLAVADAVYNPRETLLIKKKQKRQAVKPQSEESGCCSGRELRRLNCLQEKKCRHRK